MSLTLSDTGVDVEDTAAVSFSLSNGAVGSLHAGYMLRKRYGDISLVVRGTLGDVAWSSHGFDGPGHTVNLQSEAPGWETVASQKVDLEPQGGPGYGGPVGTEFVAGFHRCAQAGRSSSPRGRCPSSDAVCRGCLCFKAPAVSPSSCEVEGSRNGETPEGNPGLSTLTGSRPALFFEPFPPRNSPHQTNSQGRACSSVGRATDF